MRRSISLIALLAACSSNPGAPEPPLVGVEVVAHRGFAMRYPENTLVAFDGAWADGARGIELDVRMTADRVPVLMHDATVDRTTDGRGKVSELTLAEIARLDACAGFRGYHARCGVPTLESVLRRSGGRGAIYVEMKPPIASEDVARVVELVRAVGAASQVILASFDLSALLQVRGLDPTMQVALISNVPPSEAAISALGPTPFVLVEQTTLLADPAFVARAAAGGVRLGAWTATTRGQARALVAAGIPRVFSDTPL